MSSLLSNVDFNMIRYANCWEDADILLQGLSLSPGNDILSIASAGDNSLALLTTHPRQVYAIDISMPQLYLTELKRAAFECLDYTELLQLIGVKDATNRSILLNKVKATLSAGAGRYWDEHKKVIAEGLVYGGKFEKYFAFFRNRLLPWVHQRQTVRGLLTAKTAEEQEVFFKDKWNTWRWKWLMSIFFSRYVMGKYGRDPEFMKHLDISVSRYIRQKAEAHLSSGLAPENYFLHMIFTGDFGSQLPFYLREEHFETIKKNIYQLELAQVSADEAVKAKTFDAYNLSNVFEYMSMAEFKYLAGEWKNYIPAAGKLGYWNLMARRMMSEVVPEAFVDDTKADALSLKDKGFFYSRFVLEERK